MMSLTFGLFTQVSGSGPLCPLVKENICCDPSLEPSWHDSPNDGSQNRYLWRNMANYPQIIPVTPSYQEHCI